MDKILNKLKDEPVRLRLYSLVGLIALYLMSKGVISVDDVEFLVGLAGIVLAVESARAKVSPTQP